MKNRTDATPLPGIPGTRASQRVGPVSSAPSAIDELARARGAGVAAGLGALVRGPQPGTAAIATAAAATTLRTSGAIGTRDEIAGRYLTVPCRKLAAVLASKR